MAKVLVVDQKITVKLPSEVEDEVGERLDEYVTQKLDQLVADISRSWQHYSVEAKREEFM